MSLESALFNMGVVGDLVSSLRPANDDEPVYECRQCGRRFPVEHHQCPACESYSVERVNWETDPETDQ